MKNIILYFLLVGLLRNGYSEVERIEVTWNALACLDICIPLLQRSLTGIKHADNIQVNAKSGAAVMGWNPNYPFSYEPFRAAFAATGILIREMRVIVRGTISNDSDNFYLISNGDDARFLLIGTLHPEVGRYIPKYNLASYPLSPAIKERFSQAEQNRSTVIVSGPLFMPEKYPRTLICEQVKVDVKTNLMDRRFIR